MAHPYYCFIVFSFEQIAGYSREIFLGTLPPANRRGDKKLSGATVSHVAFLAPKLPGKCRATSNWTNCRLSPGRKQKYIVILF